MTAAVTIIGNITRDPELRFTNGDKSYCSFSIAVNRRVKGDNGWEDGETSFFDVVVWDEQGEHVAETLQRGDRVVVHGRLEQRSWTHEGSRRSKVEVVASEVGVSLLWVTADVHRRERS